MRLPELRDELPNQTKEALGLQRKAEQLSELPADDAEGDAVEIPGQDGAREKSGEETQPGDAAADAHDPGEHGQDHGERDVPLGIVAGQGCDGCRDQRAGRSVRSHDQLPRRTEEGVGNQRQNAGVQTVDRRYARKRRVGNGDRHGDGGNREAGEQVGGQPGGVVGAQDAQPRHDPIDGALV